MKKKRNQKSSNQSYAKYAAYEQIGLHHAYVLENNSPVSEVICFEKDGDLAAMITTIKNKRDFMLMGLPLVFADRVEKQDYIFELIK